MLKKSDTPVIEVVRAAPNAEFELHELALLFPEMTPEAFVDFKESVEKEDLDEPIWLHEGKVIDGRHRLRACQETGVQVKTRVWDGKGSLVEFVLRRNAKRRNLTSSQRAVIALQVKPMLAAEARERQKALAGTRPNSKSKDDLGQTFDEGQDNAEPT